MITSESTPGVLAATGRAVRDPQAGRLYRLNGGTGAATRNKRRHADVRLDRRSLSLFPDDFPDSNPYGVLVTRGAGPPARSSRMPGRTPSARSAGRYRAHRPYIPNETGPFRDATPTCIAQGPDGYLYVGTLDFVANLFDPPGTGGFSNVWRVDPNANYPTAPACGPPASPR